MITIPCWVACRNSEGVPELFHVGVLCTKEQYENGGHYDGAKAAAKDCGLTPCDWVADHNDPGYATIELEREDFDESELIDECVKCGNTIITVKYIAEDAIVELPFDPSNKRDDVFLYRCEILGDRARLEHLHKTCCRCQYDWREPTLDTETQHEQES